jgi:hypothetical protein
MAQTTCYASFGPVLGVAAFLGCHIVYLISYNLYVEFSTNKTRKKRRKNLLMVQTMHNASFGLVLVGAAFPRSPQHVLNKI